MNKKLGLLVVAVASISVAACGTNTEQKNVASRYVGNSNCYSTPDSFVMINKSDKGRISPSEYSAHQAKAFADADSNRDGILSHSEYVNHARGPRCDLTAHMFAYMDMNGDNQLTSRESSLSATRMFQRMDTDQDGYVSVNEYTTHIDGFRASDFARPGSQHKADAKKTEYRARRSAMPATK